MSPSDNRWLRGFFSAARAQSGIELVIIVGALLFIIAIALGALQARTLSAQKEADAQFLESVANIIRTEVRLAEEVDGDYSHEFEIPMRSGGRAYVVERPDAMSVRLALEETEHIVFLNANVGGNVLLGKNVIRKAGRIISFN